MAINRELYPKDWDQISERIRFERAGNHCEWCSVANYAVGARDRLGTWHNKADILQMRDEERHLLLGRRWRNIKIVLTVAHLDHDPANNAEENLAALCQRCHLAHEHRECDDRDDNWRRIVQNQEQRQIAAGQLALGVTA